jgi:hypothetical protein
MSRKQWRCFHCDAVFTRAVDAAEHFGGHESSLTACQIKGHEHRLVAYVREMEAALARWQSESHPLLLAMERMQAENAQEARRAEEIGYQRGVRDMRAQMIALAKLAADTPQFDNPLHAWEAQRIRDEVLQRWLA